MAHEEELTDYTNEDKYKLTTPSNEEFNFWETQNQSIHQNEVKNAIKDGRGGFWLPLTIWDDVELTLRYTAAIMVITAIVLYSDPNWVKNELPLIVFGLIFPTLLSQMPYLGGAITLGISMTMGMLMACVSMDITIEILGYDTTPTNYTVPLVQAYICNATRIFIPANATLPMNITHPPYPATPTDIVLLGSQGDPNPVAAGFIFFFVILLFCLLGTTIGFVKGATAGYGLFFSLWYSYLVTPSAIKIDHDDFYKYVRTLIFGISILIMCYLIPLPRILPTFIPQPRLSINQLMLGIQKAQGVTAYCFVALNKLYLNAIRSDELVHEPALIEIESKLDSIDRLIIKLSMLIKMSARWEPLFLPFPFIYGTTMKIIKTYLIQLQGCTFFLHAMADVIRSARGRKFLPCKVNFEEVEQHFQHLNQAVSNSLVNRHTFEKCCCSFDGEEDMEQLKKVSEEFNTFINELFMEKRHKSYAKIVKQKTTMPTHKENESEIKEDTEAGEIEDEEEEKEHQMNWERINRVAKSGHHGSYLWSVNGFTHTVIVLEELSRGENPRNTWMNRILDWPKRILKFITSWLMFYVRGVIFFGKVLIGKRSVRKLFALSYRRVIGSVLVALAALVALLIVLVTEFRQDIPSGSTVVLTALQTVDRDHQGLSVLLAIMRLGGTTLGIAVTYFVISIWPDSNLALILSILIYCLVGRFFMQNDQLKFLFLYALISIYVIYFSVQPQVPQISKLAILRAVSVGLGVLIGTFFMFLWPISIRTIMRYGIAKNITERIVPLWKEGFEFTDRSPRKKKKLLKQMKSARKSILKQLTHIPEAVFELTIFKPPFNPNSAEKLIEAEKQLLRAIGAFLRLTMSIHEKCAERGVDFELPPEFAKFRDEVCTVINISSVFLVTARSKRPLRGMSGVRKAFINIIRCVDDLRLETELHGGVYETPSLELSAMLFSMKLVMDRVEAMEEAACRVIYDYRNNMPPSIFVGIPPSLKLK